MARVAGAELGLPLDSVTVRLGDTDLPAAPVHGASRTAGTVAPAVQQAAAVARAELAALASADPASPLHGVPTEQIGASGGALHRKATDHTNVADPIGEVLRRAGRSRLDVERRAGPPELSEQAWNTLASGVNTIRGPKDERVARFAFAAHFVEVAVKPGTGALRVLRVVSRADIGRVLDPARARGQLLGGLVFGLGMALSEAVVIDPVLGRSVSASPIDYHIPASAQMPRFDLGFIEPAATDAELNPLGAKGVGEIGTVGLAAAVANAVRDATGIRFRTLPISADRLVAAAARSPAPDGPARHL